MKRWNEPRFDPSGSRGHVESHFLKLNDPSGHRALWLKTTTLRRVGGEAVAEAWAVSFVRGQPPVAAKQTEPAADARISRDEMSLTLSGSQLKPGSTAGKLQTGEHTIEWELAFEGPAPPFAFLPGRLYDDRLPTGKFVSPFPDLRFRGTYHVDGVRVEVDDWPGMLGHNWGRSHPYAYGWGHCNVWEGADDLVVEGISARVRVGPALLPPLTLLMASHEGRRHHFTLPGSLRRAQGDVTARSWSFRATNDTARIEGRFEAESGDFAGLGYEDPDGGSLACLNTKLAHAELRLDVEGAPPVRATSKAAALEIGTREREHGVPILV